MELKAKGVLVHGNIDNRCLRVEHHQDSHANARPRRKRKDTLRFADFSRSVIIPSEENIQGMQMAKQRLCMWRFFLSLEDRHCSLESDKTGSRALKQKLITLTYSVHLFFHLFQ
ncbi:hypothetical protein NC652_022585 [Populus alba x Populus x berolinensis]|nr:hypothetical protein NC652_022585 [Populus alba x Populus x berolinensis]